MVTASQSNRGRILVRKVGLQASCRCFNSASSKWSGKEAAEILQLLTAQVRKLIVSSFITMRGMRRTGRTGRTGEGSIVPGCECRLW